MEKEDELVRRCAPHPFLKSGPYVTALPANSCYKYECHFHAPQFTFSTSQGVLIKIYEADGAYTIDVADSIRRLQTELAETKREVERLKERLDATEPLLKD